MQKENNSGDASLGDLFFYFSNLTLYSNKDYPEFLFNEKLNKLCDKLDLTPTELAPLIKTSRGSVSSWRLKRYPMGKNYYKKLLTALPTFLEEKRNKFLAEAAKYDNIDEKLAEFRFHD